MNSSIEVDKVVRSTLLLSLHRDFFVAVFFQCWNVDVILCGSITVDLGNSCLLSC